jgi:hypothetical protein
MRIGRDGKSACAAALVTPQTSQHTDSKARALFMAAILPTPGLFGAL